MATVNHALADGGRIIVLAPGVYNQTVDLTNARYGEVSLRPSAINDRVIFRPSSAVASAEEEAVSGYTRVYMFQMEYSFAAANTFLFQDGVPDASTQILDADRHPLQRGYAYRCQDTAIRRTAATTLSEALSEIENDSAFKWFSDGTTVYFSRPETVSEQHPICMSRGGALFSGGSRAITLHLDGIEAKYIKINVNNTCSATLKNCKCTNVFGDGCFTFNGALSVEFRKCEAARGFSGNYGDGFNGHSGDNGDAFAYQTNALFVDCWSHDNRDDGSSDHERCESTYIGGLFENNAYGGGVVPALGSHTTCYNTYCRKNGQGGFVYVDQPVQAEGGVGGQIACYGCLSDDNNSESASSQVGGYVLLGKNNRATLVNCVAVGEKTGYYVKDATSGMILVSCEAINCTRNKGGQTANITELSSGGGGGGAVDSVNGQTGEVVLDADDVGAYALPTGGVPKTDLASDVQTSLGKADSALQSAPVSSVNSKTGAVVLSASDVGAGTYSKPGTGIPSSDLASAVQTSLGKADTAYQKPSSGIPAADLASGVIPTVPSASDDTPQALGTAAAGSSAKFSRADHVHAKPTYSKSDVGLGNVDNVQQYSASNPPPYPVASVDGKTGTVTVLPSNGNSGQVLKKNSASDYDVKWADETQVYPSAYCTTAAATAAKKANCSLWAATANSWLHVLIGAANTATSALTLNVNSTGAAPIYINGTASSATNYTLPAGSYLVFFDGTNFYFRTDGKLTGDITGHAGGDIAAPSSPTVGDFLVYTSNGWAAQSLSTWQGGSY